MRPTTSRTRLLGYGAMLLASGCGVVPRAPSDLAVVADVPPGPPGSPPPPPSFVLTWTDNSRWETAFEVERAVEGSPDFAWIGSADQNATGYTDPPFLIAPGVYALAACYRVRAVNDAGASGYSNAACASTPPPGP